jgi:integrase/recombinase XerD
MIFQSVQKAFLRHCAVERRMSPYSVAAYGHDLNDFRSWLPTGHDPRGTTSDHLKDYLANMVSERGLSPATVRRRIACLRSFFKWLSETSEVASPFVGWHPKLPRRRRLPRALSRNESAALIGATKHGLHDAAGQMRVALRLMVSTGIRVGELCGLKLQDVSSDCCSVRILGKGSRDRVAYLADPLLQRELAQLVALRRSQSSPLLLLNRLGRPMRAQSVRSSLRRIAAGAGVQRRITPHMLRHTAATLLIETGVDIRFVQRLLGHSSNSTTEIYTHISDQALRATLERANVLVGLTG